MTYHHASRPFSYAISTAILGAIAKSFCKCGYIRGLRRWWGVSPILFQIRTSYNVSYVYSFWSGALTLFGEMRAVQWDVWRCGELGEELWRVSGG